MNTKNICAVTAENLSHSFGEHQVLNCVSFHVQAGEIFGLLGPSGAGKTTLIRILTGQLTPTEGRAALSGKDTRKLGAAEHRQIGAMMDDLGLYERLSVYDNLAFFADIYHISRRGIDGLLKDIGLSQARKTPVARLSKGMRNRLCLARALMNRPKILFLDEPTSGLDPVTAREIHSLLGRQKEMGTAIFLTTHNMSEAETLCDRVALLNGGSIIESGNPADICRKYNRLNLLQITFRDGRRESVKNDGSSALLMKKYLEENVIDTIHSTEPTLETVFIELTGRGLD